MGFATTTRPNPSLIASAQGFFVFARNLGSSSFSFSESSKPAGGPHVAGDFRLEDDYSVLNIGLGNGTLHDNTYVYVSPEASTTGYDPDYDAFKMPNTALSVSTNTFGQEMAMNGVSTWTEGMEVPVTVNMSAQGKYKLLLDGEGTLGGLPQLYLRDSHLSTYTAVSAEGVTEYPFTVDGSPSSKGGLRFAVVSGVPAGVVTGVSGGGTSYSAMSVYPNPASSDAVTVGIGGAVDGTYLLELVDVNGAVVRTQEVSGPSLSGGFRLTGLSGTLSAGVYTVKASGATQVFQQKLVYRK